MANELDQMTSYGQWLLPMSVHGCAITVIYVFVEISEHVEESTVTSPINSTYTPEETLEMEEKPGRMRMKTTES